MYNRKISLLLCVLMIISILAGCSNGSVGTSSTPSTEPIPVSASPSSGGEEEITGPSKLPIVDEPLTFKIWSASFVSASGLTDSNESYAYKKLEELTNIHIEWTHPVAGRETELFNLTMSSGLLPDSFMSLAGYYIGGLQKYVDDGLILDLTDLISKNAYHYNSIRESDPSVTKFTISDSKSMIGFYGIKTQVMPTWLGPIIRDDWLKDLGLSAPVTYDDWTKTLTAFRDNYNTLDGVLTLYSGTLNGLDESFMNGFGVNATWFQADGKVKYSPLEEGYKSYIQLMSDWYAAGLIFPDFNVDSINFKTEYTSTGKLGAWVASWNFIDFYYANADDSDYALLGTAAPVTQAGNKRTLSMTSYVPTNRYQACVGTITTECQKPEYLVRWYDYGYSEEGSLLYNYGVEGISYDKADGKPIWQEHIYKTAGQSLDMAYTKYCVFQMHPFLFNGNRQITPITSKSCLDARVAWDSNYAEANSFPAVSLTTDESTRYSSVYNDIDTYISENVVKFINGTKPMSEFDNFVQGIRNMGIDEIIAIQQAALERYNARS